MTYLYMYFEKTSDRDMCGQKARDFEKWSKKFILPELIKTNKSRILSLVGKVYAQCSGTLYCGTDIETCTCGDSFYNDQCSEKCSNCCGPGPDTNAYDCSCTNSCNSMGHDGYDCSSLSSQNVCVNAFNAFCDITDCRLPEECSWCTCSWGSWSPCYDNGNGYCIRDRACTCDPDDCGSCSGDNFEECPATCDGNTLDDCPTDCGYDARTLEGSQVCSGDGSGCSTINCPATEPCCTATTPNTPVLSAPASGTIVNVNSAVTLDWDAISNWGVGCPTNSNKYEVCIMSDSTCDLL